MSLMPPDESSAILPASDITRVVIRSFYSTYNELGPGFPEFVTRTALAIVIRQAGLKAYEEIQLPVWFRGQRITTFKADLVVADKVIVEVKVGVQVEPFHKAQLMHYLKATDLEVGLLLHFGREPRFHRVIYENSRKLRYFEPPAPTELNAALRNNELDGADRARSASRECGDPRQSASRETPGEIRVNPRPVKPQGRSASIRVP